MESFISRIVITNQCNKIIDVFYEGYTDRTDKLHICTIDVECNKVYMHVRNNEHIKLIATVIQLVGGVIVDKLETQ